MMDPEIKAKWLTALRSGEFQQARNMLKNKSGAMCCLGVLAHIQEPAYDMVGRFKSELPVKLAAGLFASEMLDLAHRNDGTGGYQPQTFAEIADHIEKDL